MSKWPIYLAALFSNEASFALTRWGHNVTYNNEKSKQVLNLRYETDTSESVKKTA